MQKGEFDVIKGKGKPLKPGTENPYTDFMTRKMNEILINNGYQPEWVELGKEIREHAQEAKNRWEAPPALSPLGLYTLNDQEFAIILVVRTYWLNDLMSITIDKQYMIKSGWCMWRMMKDS